MNANASGADSPAPPAAIARSDGPEGLECPRCGCFESRFGGMAARRIALAGRIYCWQPRRCDHCGLAWQARWSDPGPAPAAVGG